MKLPDHSLRKLELDIELRDVIARCRAVSSPVARRRAERTLAGELRRHDLPGLAAKLASLHETTSADVQRFHLAEQWRARLIEEGIAAATELPGALADGELPRLIDAARRERDTGRPPGAARALFRRVVALLDEAATVDSNDDTDHHGGDDSDDRDPREE